MFKTINIGGTPVEMVANAATPYRFHQIFSEDLVKFFVGVENGEATDGSFVIPKLAYIMHLQAEKADFNSVNEDTFYEWLEDFAPNDLVLSTGEIVGFYYSNHVSSSVAKKKPQAQKEK